MSLHPHNVRLRSQIADSSQFKPEYRLFDAESTSLISPVIQVTNEPMVVKVHNLGPGQGVAIDMVSDYDGVSVYSPFTPVRGIPLVLDEDLNAVVLFYSGRYVLRLTNGGLGTIKAFAYPFTVTHDWGDYYASLGTGGAVVRSIDEIDTNTIDITLNPDPGVGDVTIRADAILSPNQYNILQFLANGMFVRGPDNGTLGPVPTSVLDTATIDMTLAANVLSAVVIRSPDAGQILELRGNGVYVPGPQNGNPQNAVTMVLDTITIDHTLAANTLSSNLRISADAGNSVTVRADGIFVAGFAGTITSAADTNTIDHTVTAGVLTSQVIKSPDLPNLLELRPNGLYVGYGTAPSSVLDTVTIDLTLASNVLQADLRIDPSSENLINTTLNGVIVEAATTLEEELETAGDLVVTTSVLGHIVNARTGTQSTHAGVGAGSLTNGQVAVGYNAGAGSTGLRQIAIGAFNGGGVTGNDNISIGYNAGLNLTGESNVVIGNSAANNRTKNGLVFIDPTGSAGPTADFSIAIGYQVLSGALNGVSSNITAIGYGTAVNADLNSAYYVTAIGGGALSNYVQTKLPAVANVNPPVAIGSNALKSAKSFDATAIGSFAAADFCKGKTIHGSIVAIGNNAGSAAFSEGDVLGEEEKVSIFLGQNAGYDLQVYAGSVSRPMVGTDPIWSYLISGWNSAIRAEALELTTYGNGAAQESGAKLALTVGEFAGWRAALEETTVIGRRAGVNGYMDQCTVLGVDAGMGVNNYTTNYTPNFTNANVNLIAQTLTVGAHGLTVGSYVPMYLQVVSGVAPNGLDDSSSAYVFYIVDATTVRSLTPISNAGAGTFRLIKPNNKFTNSTAIGYNAEITTSNQVTLGNQFVTNVRTAGSVSLGALGGGFQTATKMHACTGVPSNANGSDGDFCFRSDGGAGTSIYHKRAGAWVGIV